MRVATIFTGVAACAVGMAQAANAQVTDPANARDVRPPHAARPAGAIFGSIRDASACGARGVDPNWLHVSTNFLLGQSRGGSPNYTYVTSVCFGFKGEYQSPPGIGINAECGGNNHGFVLGVNNGRSRSFFFGPGTGYHDLSWSHLYTVAINSWTGNDKCGEAPNYGLGLA
jgi:hypothetical protein